jgi:hypothetical protein
MREGRGSGRCNQKHYRSKFNYVCSRNKSTKVVLHWVWSLGAVCYENAFQICMLR